MFLLNSRMALVTERCSRSVYSREHPPLIQEKGAILPNSLSVVLGTRLSLLSLHHLFRFLVRLNPVLACSFSRNPGLGSHPSHLTGYSCFRPVPIFTILPGFIQLSRAVFSTLLGPNCQNVAMSCLTYGSSAGI